MGFFVLSFWFKKFATKGASVSDQSQQPERPSKHKQKDAAANTASSKNEDERAVRLSTALRGNLRRRKAQAKSRSGKDMGSKGPGLLAAIKSQGDET